MLRGLFDQIKTAIEKLKEYRQALISAAVTGKIDVREEVDTSRDDKGLKKQRTCAKNR